MSFCSVPPSLAIGTPCFSAAAMYIAQMTAAGPLMVIEVVTWSSGMPSKRISMSASDETATPHLPNSPQRHRVVVVVAVERRHVEGDREARLPLLSRYLKRSLVSSAVPKPANMRIVHGLARYIVGWTPRV